MKTEKQGKNMATILAVQRGLKPEVTEIPASDEGSCDWLREFVDGSIGGIGIGGGLTLVNNDDGLARQLPYNRAGQVGNFAIQRCSDKTGKLLSLRKKDIEFALEWLDRNEHIPPLCHVCGNIGGCCLLCVCRDVLIYCPSCYYKHAFGKKCRRCEGK